MSSNPLLVPLSSLPSLPPVGAPVRFGESSGLWLWIGADAYRPGVVAVPVSDMHDGCHAHDIGCMSLDLRPPDPPGSRVDGLDVARQLLAPGCSGSFEIRGARAPDLTGTILVLAQGTALVRWWPIPSSCRVTLDTPDAIRLAVAAVLRARGGR